MSVAKSFVNASGAELVEGAIDGLIRLSQGQLTRLHGYENAVRVVIRSDYQKEVIDADKVAIISGGGSGHEPAHAGFVGTAFLTAAVCGDVFASPTVEAVLQGILAVTGERGCLLIVKNYTGDRLNFGLAAEKAQAMFNKKVELVIVADDIALEGVPQPRGVAGTCLVQKIASYYASIGASLEKVVEAAQLAADNVRSIGVALTTCSIPGRKIKDGRLDGDIYELGLGIHGEAGRERIAMESAKDIIQRMLVPMKAFLAQQTKGVNDYCLLVNNLGSVSRIEMMHIVAEVLNALESDEVTVTLIVEGALVTSLDMCGFSISLLRMYSNEWIIALQTPTNAVGWTPVRTNHAIPSPKPLYGTSPTFEIPAGAELKSATKKLLQKTMINLIECEKQLTEWDTICGDGDCGSSVSKGANAVLRNLETYPDDPAQLCNAIAMTISRSVGGTIGVLAAIFFNAASSAISDNRTAASSLTAAFQGGTDAIMKHGGAKVGSRTLVDALVPAAAQMKNGLVAMAEGAKQGALSTKGMSFATDGRAAYLGTKHDLTGVPDPGAWVVYVILKGLSQ
eukprot:CFRG6418T1